MRLKSTISLGSVSLLSLVLFSIPALGASPEKVASGLSAPVGMAFDSKGNLYIANWSAGRIDRWRPGGELEAYIQNIPSPSGLAVDKQDRLYVATYSGGEILRFGPGKKREVFLSELSVVAGLYFDWQGNLLVAERGKSRVLSVSPEGEIRVLADKGLVTPVAAVQTGDASYVITGITGLVLHFDAKAKRMRTISNELQSPAVGLALDPRGGDAVYAVDYGGKGVYRITLDGKTRQVETSLVSPVALAIDKKGDLYVGTWSDGNLYRLEP